MNINGPRGTARWRFQARALEDRRGVPDRLTTHRFRLPTNTDNSRRGSCCLIDPRSEGLSKTRRLNRLGDCSQGRAPLEPHAGRRPGLFVRKLLRRLGFSCALNARRVWTPETSRSSCRLASDLVGSCHVFRRPSSKLSSRLAGSRPNRTVAA